MSGKNVVDSLREVMQDLLVPELKAVKVSVDALRTDLKLTTEAIRNEMKISNEALRQEMKLRQEATSTQMDQMYRSLSDKIDFTTEMRERMASLEARLPRQ